MFSTELMNVSEENWSLGGKCFPVTDSKQRFLENWKVFEQRVWRLIIAYNPNSVYIILTEESKSLSNINVTEMKHIFHSLITFFCVG